MHKDDHPTENLECFMRGIVRVVSFDLMKNPIATLSILAVATIALGCGMLVFAPKSASRGDIPKNLRSDIDTPETVKYSPIRKGL